MYARISVTECINVPREEQTQKLKDWSDSLYYNPMYAMVREQIMERQGFVSTSHSIVQYTNKTALVSQLLFDSKENFDNFVNDPQTVNIVNMLQTLAGESGLTATFRDTDQILHF